MTAATPGPAAGPRGPLTLVELSGRAVSDLRGVGPRKADALASLGVHSVADLLTTYPRRWVDRTRERGVRDLVEGEEALVLVTVRDVRSRTTRTRRKLVEVEAGDGTGKLKVTFFNQPWRERQLRPDLEVALFGKVERFAGRLQMTNPVVDLVGDRTGRIVPIYPASDKAGITSWEVAGWVDEVLARSRPRGLADPLEPARRQALHLVERWAAFTGIHRPDSIEEVQRARRRLVFDELLRVQLALVLRKRAVESGAEGFAHTVEGPLLDRFRAGLPFPLTGAQERAVAEVLADLAAPHPMHRLLQGDVGAGKTLVAVTTLLAAVQGGHQGAFMAPTEVLAEQHALGIRRLLGDLAVPDPSTLMGERPLRVELLLGRTSVAERRRILAGLAGGDVDLVIGTHALITDAVAFASLGVVVVDEQHRFGVEQRALLRAKGAGRVPDVLVMTATPIPRTAAMTVYGDLDVSVLDELPPGRTPIVTRWVARDDPAVWEGVRSAVAEGRQAFVVCPLVDDSDKLEVASAEGTYAELAHGELAGLRVGLLHGRLPASDKEAVFGAFRRHELDVLVATTVIEVGVDVPNATVMVVLDAARFGIAQLHQLRGRVGRGAHASVCWLASDADAPDAVARLEALVRTTDGFELAEVDLDLRGEGTIMGEAQAGRSDLKLASLRRDRDLVAEARRVAFEIVDADPALRRHPGLADEVRLFISDDEAEFLFKG